MNLITSRVWGIKRYTLGIHPMSAQDDRVHGFRLSCATHLAVAGFAFGMGGGLLIQLIKRGPVEVWSPFGLGISVTAGLFIAGVVWWGASIELLPSGLPYRFSRTDRGVLKWEEISGARVATFLGIRYVNVESRGRLAVRLPVSVRRAGSAPLICPETRAHLVSPSRGSRWPATLRIA